MSRCVTVCHGVARPLCSPRWCLCTLPGVGDCRAIELGPSLCGSVWPWTSARPVWHLALDLHEEPQHVIVRSALKQDLPCEELKQRTAHRERVHCNPVLPPEDDLRGPVETTHEVRSDSGLRPNMHHDSRDSTNTDGNDHTRTG